jgi:hypothetical protein
MKKGSAARLLWQILLALWIFSVAALHYWLIARRLLSPS